MFAIRLLAEPERLDVLALPVRPAAEAEPSAQLVPVAAALPDGIADELTALLPAARLGGDAGQTWNQIRPGQAPGRLVPFGIGAGDEAAWRTAGAALARAAADAAHVTLLLPVAATPAAVRGLVEGLLLASYRFRLGADKAVPALAAVDLVMPDPAEYADVVAGARTTAEMTRLARDLVNMPSSVKNPQWFAGQVADAAAGVPDLHLRVREPDELAVEGFGGIVAVGTGSANGPRLVELDWRPAGARMHVVLVGKGITFDTGGISIKPRASMKLMRKDMAGAAAVVAATLGAALRRLPVRVTTLAPLAENMVSGAAFRPGDIIRHYGGVTSETTNSDAEGRLVLADALAYAVREHQPDLVVDLATLTGANAVALGKRTAALYSEDDRLAEDVLAAVNAAGEAAWRLPLPTDYVDYLRSDLADLYSAPAQGAGSVVAALYLREFLGELRDRWVHVDMSAPSWSEGAEAELTPGATGWGVRSLLRWLETLG